MAQDETARTPERSEKADISRQRILEAAAALFREKGYATVNLRDIAARAGMKAGSLYYHFDSKETIVTEILDAGITAVHQEVKAAMADLPANTSGAELLRTGMLTHLRSLFEFNNFTSANVRIYNQVPPQVREANMKARKAYEDLWQKIFRRAADLGALREEINLKSARLMLISSMNASLEWFDPRRGNLNELANSYADVMLGGLLSSHRGSS